MICLGAFSSDSALATMKAFRPVRGLNGTLTIWLLSSSSMSMPPWWVSVIVGARKRVSSVSEKYTSCSAGTAASKVTPLDLACWLPCRCSAKYNRSFSLKAVFRSRARPTSPALPFLPTPPLKTGLMNTSRCCSIMALICSSLASGPSTSGVGKPASCSNLEPYSIPVTCMSSPSASSRCNGIVRRDPFQIAFSRWTGANTMSNPFCEKKAGLPARCVDRQPAQKAE